MRIYHRERLEKPIAGVKPLDCFVATRVATCSAFNMYVCQSGCSIIPDLRSNLFLLSAISKSLLIDPVAGAGSARDEFERVLTIRELSVKSTKESNNNERHGT